MPTSQKELNWISKNLIEVLPAAVYVCNLEGVVVAFNRCATELWGRTPRPGDTDENFAARIGCIIPMEPICRMPRLRWKLCFGRATLLLIWKRSSNSLTAYD